MRKFLHTIPQCKAKRSQCIANRRCKTTGIRFGINKKNRVMNNDTHLQFISEKITGLKSAVMYSMSNSLVKLPNDIVTAVKVDKEGQLWFLTHHPLHSIKECEQVFPVRLHFFRKGYDYSVEVSGKATIVNNNSSDQFQSDNTSLKNSVLVKMSMTNVEYREPHAKKAKTKLELLVAKSYKWLLRNLGFNYSQGSVFGKIHQVN